MILRRIALVAFVTAAAILTPGKFAQADTIVTSNITTNTTWTVSGSPYILNGSISVASGVTLTIDPGVVVKLSGLVTNLAVRGTLNAVGTPDQHITFTSGQDNGGSGGAPGQWGSVAFYAGSTGTLDYTDMRFGGWGTACQSSSLLKVMYTAIVSVDHSLFEQSDTSGLYTAGANRLNVNHTLVRGNPCGFVSSGGVASVTNTRVAGNGTGLLLNYGGVPVDASYFTYNNVTDNTYNGFQLQVASTVPASVYPSGTSNNIFGNGNKQVYTLYSRADIVPRWDGNYYGPTAAGPIYCPFAPVWPFHVFYNDDVSYPQNGPINSTTYSSGQVKCSADNLAVNSISTSVIPNEAP